MTVRVGDTVFIRSGIPATVKGKDELTGKLSLDLDQKEVKNASRHGYLNGLSEENRQSLFDILDQIKSETNDHSQRLELMRVKLEELEKDPRNMGVSRYLRAEMAHLMNTFNIRPREFIVDEFKVR